MERAYCLGTVEEEIFMMGLDYLPSDIAEIETLVGPQTLIISGWWVHVPELGINVHQGAICKYGEEKEVLPESLVTVLKMCDETQWFYYEEADFISVLLHWLDGAYPEQVIRGMPCYIRGTDLGSGLGQLL